MTEFLAILSGVIISVMILVNGELSAVYGSDLATVLVHLTGLVLSCVITVFAKKQPKTRGKVPLYMLSGGVIGVFTTYSNIYTFMALGVSLTLALGLVGQCLISLLIDGFGWFGVEKQRFAPRRVAGLALVMAGAAAMLLL